MGKIPQALRGVAPYLNLGGMLAGCMVVGVLSGYWLDKKLDTGPWLLLAGSGLGMISGFYHFFKVVLTAGKKKDNDEIDEKD